LTQQDSIQFHSETAVTDPAAPAPRQLTPAQVLKWLPPTATPAQQDSIIQAHFKPSEIRWSKRPDTLHLPGHDKGHNMLDVNIPQYYREGFFSKDSLFHPELPGGRYGVAGDPIPYNVHSDNVLTSLLLVSLMLAFISFSGVKNIILQQIKAFFYPAHGSSQEFNQTDTELFTQLFLCFLTAVLSALLFYFYTLTHIGDSFLLPSQYYLIAIYAAIISVYFVVKGLLYTWINNTFFDSKRNEQWMTFLIFVITFEGVLLFPAAMMQIYSEIPVQTIELYLIIVLILVKISTFYHSYDIFFRRNIVQVQIILYLCALELVPLLLLWSILHIVANFLKLNI